MVGVAVGGLGATGGVVSATIMVALCGGVSVMFLKGTVVGV